MTRGMWKSSGRLPLGGGAEAQSWLGPYPVTKAPSTFEDLTFRGLRRTVQADRPLMTQKELYEHVKIRRDTGRRIRQARKKEEKKSRRELLRKKRRRQHEYNNLRRRAHGLQSHRVLRRSVGQRRDADELSKSKRQSAELASEEDKSSCSDSDEWGDWEDSDGEESDHGGGDEDQEMMENEGLEEMEYDDASGELIPIPRKWGKWFNSVRKYYEGDEVL